MAFIGRFFVICFALFMATMAAGIATAIALLGVEVQTLGPDPIGHVFFWGTAAIASGFTIAAGFLPLMIAIILAEAFSIRSFVIHAAAGAALLAFAYYGASFGWTYEESIDRAPPPISRETEIV